MKYIVGLLIGGLMEDPVLRFTTPYDIIEADSDKEAKNIYNEKHKCDYFYGDVMCAVVDNNVIDVNPNCSYNECLRALEVIKNNEWNM